PGVATLVFRRFLSGGLRASHGRGGRLGIATFVVLYSAWRSNLPVLSPFMPQSESVRDRVRGRQEFSGQLCNPGVVGGRVRAGSLPLQVRRPLRNLAEHPAFLE